VEEKMAQFYEHNLAASDVGLVLDETPASAELVEADSKGADEVESTSDESTFNDDPVRFYLREMGSVRLLTRQGEIELARRMEQGTLCVRKALSRSPIVQRMVMAVYEELRQAKVNMDDLIELSASDETGNERKRAEAIQRFTKMAKLSRKLQALEKRLASTPPRRVHVRTQLCRKSVRLRIKVSQAIREIPFSSATWTTLGSAFKRAPLCANIDETESAAIITEQGGQENHRDRDQDCDSFCNQFA
jgi:hypothetical protein